MEATGQRDIPAAIDYIAEGLFLPPSCDVQQLIAAVSHFGSASSSVAALQRLARIAAASNLDTAEVLLMPEWVTPPSAYRSALNLLASKTSSGRLDECLTARVVYAAQREDGNVIPTLAAVAGLSWRELTERAGLDSPSKPDGQWTVQGMTKVFSVIDDVVCNRLKVDLGGGFAARPIELLADPDITKDGAEGWSTIEEFRRGGVPFEVLLAQRVEGGAWRTHRDRIGRKYAHMLADELCACLDEKGVHYLRASNCGGTVAKKQIDELLDGGGSQVGLVVLHDDGAPRAAIVLSVANDGGSASKAGARVMKLCGKLVAPVIAVVAGLGWQHRNETAELARAVQGRIYTERSLSQLAGTLAD